MFRPFNGTAAIFDCDDSLILGSAGYLYFRYLIENNVVHKSQRTRALRLLASVAMNRLDSAELIVRGMSLLGGIPVAIAEECARVCYRESVQPLINAAGRERAAEHRALGHLVLLASGSPSYIVDEVAADLRIHLCLGSEPVVRGGVIQSELPRAPCFGEGKRDRATALLTAHGIELGRSYLYSDSAADLPLFKLVGHPVAVNPRPKFAAEAHARGYEIERWGAYLPSNEE